MAPGEFAEELGFDLALDKLLPHLAVQVCEPIINDLADRGLVPDFHYAFWEHWGHLGRFQALIFGYQLFPDVPKLGDFNLAKMVLLVAVLHPADFLLPDVQQHLKVARQPEHFLGHNALVAVP